ncbi:MAG: hypothetical protein RR719_06255 [Akkermansia sp.]
MYISGFPSLYGGARVELYHQISVWEKLDINIHFIPTQKNVKGVALSNEDFFVALLEIRQESGIHQMTA